MGRKNRTSKPDRTVEQDEREDDWWRWLASEVRKSQETSDSDLSY